MKGPPSIGFDDVLTRDLEGHADRFKPLLDALGSIFGEGGIGSDGRMLGGAIKPAGAGDFGDGCIGDGVIVGDAGTIELDGR